MGKRSLAIVVLCASVALLGCFGGGSPKSHVNDDVTARSDEGDSEGSARNGSGSTENGTADAGGATGAAATPDAGSQTTDGRGTEQPQTPTEAELSEQSCTAGLTRCGERCVQLDNDVDHCGQCDRRCDQGLVCSEGACELSCPPGFVTCDRRCIDPTTDRFYCGAFGECLGEGRGSECQSGQICSSGRCELSCQVELLECAGRCVDPQTDRAFCGARGDCSASSTTAGQTCQDGEVCVDGACALSCQPSTIKCGGRCIDPQTDRRFCGASGACGDDNRGSAGTICGPFEGCVAGHCELQCQSDELVCSGRCIDPRTDAEFCGARGDCLGENAGTRCSAGQRCDGAGRCGTACISGYALCGGVCVPAGQCPPCGQGGICNPGDLGGVSCQSLGFENGGVLQCNPVTCTLDTALCIPDMGGTGGTAG